MQVNQKLISSRVLTIQRFIEWDKLVDVNNELIKLRFIAGLIDNALKLKILEKLQISPNITLTEIVDFCQMKSQCEKYVSKQTECPQPEASFFINKHKNQQSHKKSPCSKCGRYHPIRQCPAYKHICHNCNKPNHFTKMCKIKEQTPTQRSVKQTNNVDVFIIDSSVNEPIMKTLKINNGELNFQLDTGAAISIMSKSQWQSVGAPKLKKTNICPTNYDGSIITTLGIIEAQIETADNFKLVDFVVVNTDKAFGLLGRNAIDQNKSQLHTFAIESRHLPLINNFKAELKLKENYKPLKFCPARKVPIHVKELLDKELKELEAHGIITPIQFSSSCSPVVWVKKTNGRYRMCADYKGTLNTAIESDSYPCLR